jgi:hypothetical protein
LSVKTRGKVRGGIHLARSIDAAGSLPAGNQMSADEALQRLRAELPEDSREALP